MTENSDPPVSASPGQQKDSSHVLRAHLSPTITLFPSRTRGSSGSPLLLLGWPMVMLGGGGLPLVVGVLSLLGKYSQLLGQE